MEYDGLQASGNHWQKWSRPEIHQSTWTVLKLAYTTGETFDILWVQTSLHYIIEFKQFLPSIHFESRKGCLYPDKIFGVHWASPPSEPERLHNSDWLGVSWHQKYDWVPNLELVLLRRAGLFGTFQRAIFIAWGGQNISPRHLWDQRLQ